MPPCPFFLTLWAELDVLFDAMLKLVLGEGWKHRRSRFVKIEVSVRLAEVKVSKCSIREMP